MKATIVKTSCQLQLNKETEKYETVSKGNDIPNSRFVPSLAPGW